MAHPETIVQWQSTPSMDSTLVNSNLLTLHDTFCALARTTCIGTESNDVRTIPTGTLRGAP